MSKQRTESDKRADREYIRKCGGHWNGTAWYLPQTTDGTNDWEPDLEVAARRIVPANRFSEGESLRMADGRGR